ncbi:MAG: thioesterase family protein [Pseudomonadota bacterium]
MYPYIQLLTRIWRARRKPPLQVDDVAVIERRAGFTDIDIFGELNNARQLVYFELGRWDYSQRVGFIGVLRRNRWGLVVGGASVRYRRRVPLWSKFEVRTQLLCHDGRWFYFLQEIYRKDEICTSALIKAGVTHKGGLVPAPTVVDAMGAPDWDATVPDWVQSWIDAEGTRPWPA